MSSRPRRYRKGGYATIGGKEITGLKRRPDGRFYSADTPTKTFGKDPHLALHKFNQWREAQGEPIVIEFDPMNVTGAIERERQRIRTLILTDPRQAALELDIPHLAYHPAEPAAPDFDLKGLLDYYHKECRYKGKPLSATNVKEGSSNWDEFVRFVGVRYVADITEQVIESYGTNVLERYDRDDYSPTWVKHKFDKVKAVLRFAIKRNKDAAECERVLRICTAYLNPPPKKRNAPRPITREELHALLKVANKRQKGIILCGLNFCMHSGEVVGLLKADIQGDELVTTRPKTDVVRVAVVWERTRKAIEALEPHGAEHIFVGRTGKPLTNNIIGEAIRGLRKRAGLTPQVSFDSIRDGAYTAAVRADVGLDKARLLAGHSTGISDAYVQRHPQMVADCCRAIEAHYFG